MSFAAALFVALLGVAADVPLSGSIIVEDPERPGICSATPSGTIEFRFYSARDGLVTRTVPVELGDYATTMPEHARVAVGGLVLEDRWADPVERGFRERPENGVLDLRAHWGDSMVVRVVDAENGTDLRDVTIRFSRDVILAGEVPFRPIEPRDDPASVVRERASSPLRVSSYRDLVRPHRSISFDVSAPGYSRKTLPLSGEAGDRVVALVPVAGLEVALEGGEGAFTNATDGVRWTWRNHPRTRPARQCVLTLRRAGAVVVERRIPVPGKPETFPSLEPGAYEIEVALGPTGARPLVLARAAATLVKGRLTEASLSLAEPPAEATILCDLSVPEAWRNAQFAVAVEPRDVPGLEARAIVPTRVGVRDPNIVAGACSEGAFVAEGLLPGRYALVVTPFGGEREVVVGPGEALATRIDLSPPAHVRVVLVDAATGEPVGVASVSFATPGRESEPMPADRIFGVPGRHRFTCSAGEVVLFVEHPTHAARITLRGIAPGETERTVAVPRAAGFVLSAASGAFPFGPVREALDVRAIDGGEAAGLLSAEREGDSERLRCVLTRPGRYRVAFRPLPYSRFEEIPAFEVDLAPGQFAEKVIPFVEVD